MSSNASDTARKATRKSWFKKELKMPVPAHTGIYKLHLQATATLGTEEVRESVRKPPGINRDDWIAANVLTIYQEVSQLAAVLEDICTEDSCPRMSAGKHVQYSWADEANPEPRPLSAPEYMRTLVTYAEDQLSNRELLPVNGSDFPPDFMAKMSMLLKRFFRVYAHAYLSHFEPIQRYGAEAHVNMCFKHFLFFVIEFDLVSRNDMGPLDGLIQKFLAAAEEGAAREESRA